MLFYMCNIMGTDHHLVCYLSHYISYSTEKDISTCHERKLEVVYRNGTLRAYFFRDIWRVEKVRKKFDAKEIQIFKAVLLEGQAKGVFHIDDVEMTADLIHYCVKGIEVPYIRGHIGAHLDEETRNKYVSNIVFGALHRTEI